MMIVRLKPLALALCWMCLAGASLHSTLQTGSGAERLAGNWSHQQVDGNGDALANLGPPLYRAHYRLDVRGRDVRAFQVFDEDWALGLKLKGDENLVYQFQVNGRRISGSFLTGKRNLPLEGIINENFDDIRFQFTDNDAKCFNSLEDARAGRGARPCSPSFGRLRRIR